MSLINKGKAIRIPRGKGRLLTYFVISGTVLAACSSGGGAKASVAPTATTAATGTCASYYPLTVADVQNFFGANTFTAQAAGFFHKNCLNVTVDKTESGPAMTALVVSGHAQIGDTISSGLFPGIQKGLNTNIKWLMTSEGWDFNLIAAPGTPLPHLHDPWPAPMKDTIGKTIGVTAPGSTTYFEALAWLHQAHIPLSSVTIVGVGAGATSTAALESGKIQFMVDSAPQEQLLGSKGFVMVVNAAGQKGNGPGLPKVFYNTAFATTQTFAKAHPNVVTNFCRAIWQTWRFESNPANVGKLASIYEKVYGLTQAQAISAWKETYPTLNPTLTPAEFKNFELASPAGEQNFAPPYGQYVDQQCASGTGLGG